MRSLAILLLGFGFRFALKELTLISLGIIGLCLAVMYLATSEASVHWVFQMTEISDPPVKTLIRGKKMADWVQINKSRSFPKLSLRSYFSFIQL